MLDFIQKRSRVDLLPKECRNDDLPAENDDAVEETEKVSYRQRLKDFAGGIKNIKISKRTIAAVASVFVIGFAVFANWFWFGDGEKPANDNSDKGISAENDESLTTFFAVTQINRQRARDEAMDVLQNVIDDAGALETQKAEALSSIGKIADEIAMEADIETLVKGKGFEECVALLNGENASVIVKTEGLMPNELSQIREIVYQVSGVVPANLNIIEK